MRILLTIPSLNRGFGGPVVKVSALAEAIRGLDHHVGIVGCGEEADEEGVTAIKPAFHFHSTPVPRALKSLKEAISRSDVVHIVGLRDPVGIAAAHFANRANVPYVLEPAGMHRRRMRSIKLKSAFDALIGHRIMENAVAVIANSSLEKSELLQGGVTESSVFVRPNGLVLGRHPGGANRMRRQYGIPQEVPLVVHLGRISRIKGIVPLIRAVESMQQVWLLIAGTYDGDGSLPAIRMEAERVGERVIIESGGLWDEDKWAAYAEADVFCLHSESESFGNAAAEAAAVGLPVAITDSCGVMEWLDSEASRVVRFGDLEALVKALGELLEPSAKRAAVRAAPAIRQALDWQSIAKKQIEIYESVIRVEASN